MASGFMPCARTAPRQEPNTGLSTAASAGPALPISGLPAVEAPTSWSYCRITVSRLAMFGWASRTRSDCSVSDEWLARGVWNVADRTSAPVA